LQISSNKEATHTISKLRCAAGLAELAMRKYKAAAKYFLEVNFDHCDFTDIISTNNVAVYAGLCALATFDRSELQEKVVSSRFSETYLYSIWDQIFTEICANNNMLILSTARLNCFWSWSLRFETF